MWTRTDIVTTPDNIHIQFAPGAGRHVLAWLVMVGAGLSVYGLLEQGDVGPVSLVLSAVVILLGALMRMGLRARSSVELSKDGLLVVRRGLDPLTVPFGHIDSFSVARTGAREGIPLPQLRVVSRNENAGDVRVGKGSSVAGLTALADQLTERLVHLRTV
jgi:hypothetical protein